MGLEAFRSSCGAQYDYSDYNKELAAEINSRISNEEWLSNQKQRYYVVETVERTLAKSYPPSVSSRRTRAQSEVTNEIPDRIVKDKQTIQDACHTRLFKDYEQPPTNYQGEAQWHILFDDLIRAIEQDKRTIFSH
jgi:hypothetical protein